MIACGLDETGYAVSAITDDGYLRVHMNGNGRHAALWDQYHEGQRVVVAVDRPSEPVAARYIPGVFAVRSNHLWRRRVADDTPTSIENLWIDVGARSRAEAQRMGVDVSRPGRARLAGVDVRRLRGGPGGGNRAGCAAVVGRRQLQSAAPPPDSRSTSSSAQQIVRLGGTDLGARAHSAASIR